MVDLPADVARLQATARALLEEDDGSVEALFEARADAYETMLYAAAAIDRAGMIGQMGWVAWLLEQVEDEDPTADHDVPIVEAIGALLARLPADDPRWRRYATSEDPRLRRVVAERADSTTAAGSAWIQALRRDGVDAVRSAARARPLDAPVEWWSGAFSFDPWTVVPREQRGELEGALRTVVEAAELSAHQRAQDGAAIAAALVSLPTPLLRDAVERLLLGWGHGSQWLDPVLGHVLAGPGGPAWLWERLARVDLSRVLGKDLTTMLGAVPAAVRAPVLVELAGALVAAALREDDEAHYLAHGMVQALASSWPAEADPLPLVAVIGRLDARTHLILHRTLVGVLVAPAHADAVAPRLLEEQERGEGALRALLAERAAAVIAAASPALVRPFAVRALHAEEPARRAWAVAEVLGRCHQPEHDPPREALAAELWGRPATRAAVLEQHASAIVGLLRAKLRSKEGLTLEEARALVGAREGKRRVRLDVRAWTKLRRMRRSLIEAEAAAGVGEAGAPRPARARRSAAPSTPETGLAALFPRARWTVEDWDDFAALLRVDGSEAERVLATLERQTARRAEQALEALVAVTGTSSAREALARWRAFHG